MHVHTPASVEQHFCGAQPQEADWDEYLAALAGLPPEVRAVGINDYFTVDGYRRVRAAWAAGKLPNLDLILPVVELRLTAFAGHPHLKKLNYHVVFSDALPPDQIEQFFLRGLAVELHLDGAGPWRGCVGTAEGLEELGRAVREATPAGKLAPLSDRRVGFNSAAVPVEKVASVLEQSVFDGKVLTALGLGEWSQLRLDGAGAAQKRDAIGRVDFVLTASPSLEKYEEQRGKLAANQFNSRLVDASDAHYYQHSPEPNRLGQGRTWVKADLTFEGLRRAVARFGERVWVGDVPPKLERVRGARTKYIQSIEVRRNPDSKLNEAWFDAKLELSPDLVAIIGNQGGGKSALTDVIALCGGSTAQGFSFLTPNRFRDRQNKAGQFTATLTWENGTEVKKRLDEDPDPSGVEQVRYVPQGFFDQVTNEPTVAPGGRFYSEVTKAVFSHVPQSERLDCATFEELVLTRTRAAEGTLAQLRRRLSGVNQRIAENEAMCAPGVVARVRAQLAKRDEELASLRASPPDPVTPPAAASAEAAEVERLRAAHQDAMGAVRAARRARAALFERRNAIQNALTALRAAADQAHAAAAEVARDLADAGVEADAAGCLTVVLDTGPLDAAFAGVGADIASADRQLDPGAADSLVARAAALDADREARERALQSAAGAYQNYRTRLADWERRVTELEGEAEGAAPESRAGLAAQLHELTETRPAALRALEDERRSVCRDIHGALRGLADVYTELTAPVQRHIETEPITREKYRLAFDVSLSEAGLADRLFGCVGQTGGTFAGKQQGRDRLRQLSEAADFLTADGAVAFADELLDQLRWNRKLETPTPVDLASLLKQGASVQALYDVIYSLEYLAPVFSLGLNGKPLRQLSPGERGILLLVFYLLVDRGDEPLVIDQPEGNLNNQSIVDHLVPAFLAAKARRQVIIVTHNPNLGVVCDAEQVVHCRMDLAAGCKIEYESGALENPKFNRLTLDVLEGTGRAFAVRRDTYAEHPG